MASLSVYVCVQFILIICDLIQKFTGAPKGPFPVFSVCFPEFSC